MLQPLDGYCVRNSNCLRLTGQIDVKASVSGIWADCRGGTVALQAVVAAEFVSRSPFVQDAKVVPKVQARDSKAI